MLRLALLTFRARRGTFAGTFAALLLGSAVLSACGILLESGLRSSVEPQRYAAADAVVAGPRHMEIPVDTLEGPRRESVPLTERAPVPAAAAGRIADVAGVRDVVPDIGFPARLIGADGAPVPGRLGAPATGHNWSGVRLGAYELTRGRAPRGDGEVVLDADLARRAGAGTGDELSVMTGSEPRAVRVTGIVSLPEGTAPRRSAVFFSDAEARHLVPGGTVTAYGVLAEPGTDTGELARSLDAALTGGPEVYTGDRRGHAEFPEVAVGGGAVVTLAAAVGGNVLLVAVLVVHSTMSLSVRHRRREIALLRAVGATPRQIRRMVAAETSLVAAVAGVLGWPVGVVLVHWTRDRFAGYGIVPPDFRPVIGPLPVLGAVLVTVLTALTAVLVAALRASRVPPSEALGGAAAEPAGPGRGRTITGLVLAGCAVAAFGTGLRLRGDFQALVGLANSMVLMLVVAAAVLGPLLARGAARFLGPVLRRTGVTGGLAAANTRADAHRFAGAVTPLVLAVSFAATVVFAQTTALEEAADQTRAGLVADRVLTSAAGVEPGVVERVRDLPQVETATGLVRSEAVAVGSMLGEETSTVFQAQGLDPRALGRTVDLDVRDGDPARLRPGTVAVSARAASLLDLDVGGGTVLWLGDGTRVEAEVVAVYERGTGFADLTFDHDTLLAHTTDRRDTTVLVAATGGAEAGKKLDEGLADIAARYPGTVVRADLAVRDQLREQEANAWVNYLVVGIIIAYTGVTVVNTQAMNTATRRREFALLRLAGAHPRQVRRMMRRETLAVVTAGVVIGTAACLLPLALVALAVNGAVVPGIPPLGLPAVAATAAVLAAAGTMIPTRLLLRIPPAETLGARE
ncbi:FtsX-like permease family protein [Streptomyces sp. Ru87]|uniref:FtsX-like permease family protein n=1 Tax=Streptomyces sp. Ru87 TaxID=2044307 RepID=UPI000BF940C1|nr:FtsX-like permease family protein [Streptomyces sp. Ru87]PGH50678.1 ABC transporter permease [Streptomyces sp. Ru87]